MSESPYDRCPSRRQFCRAAVTAAVTAVTAPRLVLGGEQSKDHGPDHAAAHPFSPEKAIERLLEGNRRFVKGKADHPHESKDWRLSLEGGQHPFAVIVGCADSRVCPELVFDQGLGDLFVIRVAGNIVDVDVTASVEYAVDHLDTRLVVVLGHSNCGAVTAALDHLSESAGEPDEIVSLLYRIEPALVNLPQNLSRDNRIAVAVERNVRFAVRRLSAVPDLMKSMRSHKLRIVGAVYDMHTGKVKLVNP